jgi:hypothetical protein
MPIARPRGLGRTVGRLLMPTLATLALACDDATFPDEPEGPSPAEPAGGPAEAITSDRVWADGYVLADNPTSAGYTPSATTSLNWAGGPIRITRPDGTTGRYVVTFTGLSAALGAKSTVKATGYGSGNAYCKTVAGYLVSDKVEVRCYKAGTGTPVNTRFTLLVSRAASDRAFAFAHQPTATEYAPSAKGSWNPGGQIRVTRIGTGHYQVVFAGLGTWTNGGVALVNAVGSGKAYCTVGEFWGGSASSDLALDVACWTPSGSPVDSKFSVAFVTPAKHLAYAFGDQPFSASSSPDPRFASNPAGGAIVITRSALGTYTIYWIGADAAIIGSGNVQVSGVGTSNQCKVASQAAETVLVQCFTAGGTPTDSYFSVLLGS